METGNAGLADFGSKDVLHGRTVPVWQSEEITAFPPEIRTEKRLEEIKLSLLQILLTM